MNTYQQESAASGFKDVKPLEPAQVRLLDWAMGLGGETGEVLDMLKHSIFHKDACLDRMELAKELGDVLWYVSAIATTLGIDMADVAALNRAKLTHRYHGGDFNSEMSADRHVRECQFSHTPKYKCLQARMLNTHNAPLNIIFVGPDGAGKTTLIERVAKQLQMGVHKCDYRQENKDKLAMQLLHSQIDIIYDRFYYPDELIYSAAKNIPLDEQYDKALHDVMHELAASNVVFVYVYADLETLFKRSAAWADDYVKTSELNLIISNYKEWVHIMHLCNIPVIEVNNTECALDSTEYRDRVDAICTAINSYKVKFGTSESEGGLKVEWAK